MPNNKDDVKIVFDSVKYKNDFQRDHYDRIALNVPKGQKEIIKAYASSVGKSVNTFIWDCLQDGMSDHIILNIPKEQKKKIETYASSVGKSVNTFICECIQKEMENQSCA